MTKPILAFYGDDFTGSTDAMEVLQWAGLKTALFLESPTRAQLEKFEGLQALGIAGASRTMSPAEMDVQLRPALKALFQSGAEYVHYKTCSTFDSSPEIGSIGVAIELGREICGTRCVPMVVAAPHLGRYQAFGNLFARSGLDTVPFRLDRHPTMSHHPITPMFEADIRLHLRQQTDINIALLDCTQLADSPRAEESIALGGHCDAILFDALYTRHMAEIGGHIERLRQSTAAAHQPLFVVGSSGVESALASYWQQSGRLPQVNDAMVAPSEQQPVSQVLVITGSCSPVNDRQIAWAENHGFETIAINSARLVDSKSTASEQQALVAASLKILEKGASLILHTARGPQDARVAETLAAYQAQGLSDLEIKLHSGKMLGPKLGAILKSILQRHAVSRVGVAGGDTSGYLARELGIVALEALTPVAPGAPLCRIHANGRLDGMEFLFKGGQVGRDTIWGSLLNGSFQQ